MSFFTPFAFVQSTIEAAPLSPIGPTGSTTIPITSSGVNIGVSPSGSPFVDSVNSYYWEQASSAPFPAVSISSSNEFTFGTGDFTIEWFQYQTNTGSFTRHFYYSDGDDFYPYIGLSLEGPYLNANVTGYIWNSSGGTSLTLIQNPRFEWVHIAVVRTSGTVKLYRNGIQDGTATFNTDISQSNGIFSWGIRGWSGGGASEMFAGSFTSMRVCKGLGVYTGTFTVPTSPLGQTQSANPYGGSNTQAISSGICTLLLNP